MQKRDYAILRFLNSMKNGDADILAAYYFSSRKSARRRFLILEKNNLIKKSINRSSRGFNKYYITPLGHKEIVNHYTNIKLPPPYRKRYAGEAEHDRMVAICRLYLVKNKICFGYRSEREIACEMSMGSGFLARSFLPDALFFDKYDHRVSLEYELSIKSRKRILQKIENHKTFNDDNPNNWSLFVVKNDQTLKFLNQQKIESLKTLSSSVVEKWFEIHLKSMN